MQTTSSRIVAEGLGQLEEPDDENQQSASAKKLKLRTSIDDWAQFWPFPSFDEAQMKKRSSDLEQNFDHSHNNNNANEHFGKRKHPHFAKEAQNNAKAPGKRLDGWESSSSDDDCSTLPIREVHPLSSEWVTHTVSAPKTTNLRPVVDRVPSLSIDSSDGSRRPLSACSSSASAAGFPLSRGNFFPGSSSSFLHQPPTITKDEVTALLSVFDPENPLGDKVNMKHLDVSWMARRGKAVRGGPPISPPGVHLHLGILEHTLDSGKIGSSQVLINSPRSAIIILRSGIGLESLIRDAWAERRFRDKKAEGDFGAMSWEEKKKLATEKLRQKKVDALRLLYEEVKRNVSIDDIVSFCNQFVADRPSSALRIEFPKPRPESSATCRSVSGAAHDVSKQRGSRLPQELSRAQFQHRMDAYVAREKKIEQAREFALLTEQKKRERLVTKMIRRTNQVKNFEAQFRQDTKAQQLLNRGREDIWELKENEAKGRRGFDSLVHRENRRRRFDEVRCVAVELERSKKEFSGAVRKMNQDAQFRREDKERTYLKNAQLDYSILSGT